MLSVRALGDLGLSEIKGRYLLESSRGWFDLQSLSSLYPIRDDIPVMFDR